MREVLEVGVQLIIGGTLVGFLVGCGRAILMHWPGDGPKVGE